MNRLCGCVRSPADLWRARQPPLPNDHERIFDMWAFSMRFSNPDIESAYLRSSMEQSTKNTRTVYNISLVGLALSFLWRLPGWAKHDLPERIKTLYLGAMAMLTLLIVVMFRTTRVTSRLTYRGVELMVLVCMLVCVGNYMAVEPQFLQLLLSSEELAAHMDEMQDSLGNLAGSSTLWLPRYRVTLAGLGLVAIVNGVHFALPVRWFAVLWLDLFLLVMYPIFAFFLGGREMSYPIIIFQAHVVLAMVGLRAYELKSRVLFGTLADERKMRAEAEFQARSGERSGSSSGQNTGSEEDRRSVSAVTAPSRMSQESVAVTTATGEIFKEAVYTNDLARLKVLGQQEQWLIHPEELEVKKSEVIGQGACGKVLAGTYCKSQVAIKVFLRAEVVRTLCNEIRILRHVRHPNIALFLGACIDDVACSIQLVLERLYGQPLNEFLPSLKATSASSPESANQTFIALGISQALVYLHSRRPAVVHGDMKPANIFIEQRQSWKPVAKLLDFGLSQMVTKSLQMHGGTPKFAAPEIVRQPLQRPSPSADIFSLGTILFHIACGRKPHEGRNGQEVIKLLRSGPQPSPLSFSPSTMLLQKWKSIIELCTHEDPKARTTALEVFNFLLLTDLSTTEGSHSTRSMTSARPEDPHARAASSGKISELHSAMRPADQGGPRAPPAQGAQAAPFVDRISGAALEAALEAAALSGEAAPAGSLLKKSPQQVAL